MCIYNIHLITPNRSHSSKIIGSFRIFCIFIVFFIFGMYSLDFFVFFVFSLFFLYFRQKCCHLLNLLNLFGMFIKNAAICLVFLYFHKKCNHLLDIYACPKNANICVIIFTFSPNMFTFAFYFAISFKN